MLNKSFGLMAAMALVGTAVPASAQWNGGIDRTGGPDRTGGSGVGYGDVVGAAILSDVSADRQRERDAKRQPYATPSYGNINSTKKARDACSSRALGEVGGRAKLASPAYAAPMATGWEVEGDINVPGGGQAHFVCSVRNGSVTGLLVK